MKRTVILGCMAVGLAVSLLLPLMNLLGGNSALAWDGDWTQARSGRLIFDNPGSTDGQAGTDPPQKYYTPAPRDYSEVDPDELSDYFNRKNKDYSPYALARISQDLHYNSQMVPKGYYLIKPGNKNAGSPRVNLKTLNGPPLPDDTGLAPVSNYPDALPKQVLVSAVNTNPPFAAPDESLPDTTPALDPAMAPSAGKNVKKKPAPKNPLYEVFVIKRQGKVVLVVPIHRKQMYVPGKKDKVPDRALAWVEQEDRHPVLKFYYHNWIYSTDFQ